MNLDIQNLVLITPYTDFNFQLHEIDSLVIEQRSSTKIETQNNTKLIDSLGIVSKIDTLADKIIIEYSKNPPNLKMGDIIVNQKTIGILAKIKEINLEGNKIVIDTSFATISDAFKLIYLDTLIKVNPDDIIKLEKTIKTGSPKELIKAIDTIYTIDENGFKHQVYLKYDQPIIKKSIEKIQENSYPIEFEFPNFKFSYDDFSLEADLLTVGKDISLDFVIKKESSKSIPSYLRLAKIEKEGMKFTNIRLKGTPKKIITPPLIRFQVPLSSPPIVITTEIEVVLGTEFSAFVQSGLNSTFEFTLNSKIGFEYSNGSNKPIQMFKGNCKLSDFDRSSVGLKIKYFGEINAGIYLYGLIGPSFFIQPYINGIVEIIQPNKNKHIYFNYGCSFGGRFGSKILNIPFVEISKSYNFHTWDFYNSPEIININPNKVKIDDIITISGNYFGKNSSNNSVYFNNIKASEYAKWS